MAGKAEILKIFGAFSSTMGAIP
jgi:hypothetical protein